MVMPGLINLDFADVRSVMAEMGKAMMGTGEGEGPHRALEAAERAIANPLLDGVSMKGAKGVIISIIGGDDMRLIEVDEAANHIRDLVDPNANIIWGSAFNPDLDGKIRVSVVATGIEQGVVVPDDTTSRPFSMGTARGPARPSLSPQVAPLPFSEPAGRSVPAPAVQQEVPAPVDYDVLASEASTSASQAEAEDEPLELSVEDEADGDFSAPPASPTKFAAQDEFVLDARNLADDQPPVISGLRRRQIVPNAQPQAVPVPAPQRDDTAASLPRLGSSQEPPARPVPGGGTLFERMASLTGRRKASEEDDDDGDGGAVNVPRFLGRQNNQ
jgi:cell division protein FtsZ